MEVIHKKEGMKELILRLFLSLPKQPKSLTTLIFQGDNDWWTCGRIWRGWFSNSRPSHHTIDLRFQF